MTSAYVIMSSKLWPKVILRNFGGLSMIGFKIIEGGRGLRAPPHPSPPPTSHCLRLSQLVEYLLVCSKGCNELSVLNNNLPSWMVNKNWPPLDGHTEYIGECIFTGWDSFTQLAMVKLPSRKFLAGVVACAPAPLRCKWFFPFPFTYSAPLTRLLRWKQKWKAYFLFLP